MVKRSKYVHGHEKRLLRDLTTELGASCTEFLHVQEQCSLMYTSTRFRKYSQCGMKRARRKIIVRLWLPDVGMTATWQSNEAILGQIQKLSVVCPRVKTFFYQLIFTGRYGTAERTAIPVSFKLDTKNECTYLRAAIPLSELAVLPCAKHIEQLQVSVYSVEGAKAVIQKFQSLEAVRLNIRFSDEGMHARSLSQVKTLWSKVPRMNLQVFADHKGSTALYETEQYWNVLSTWNNLESLDVVIYNRSIDCTSEGNVVCNLFLSLPTSIKHLSYNTNFGSAQPSSQGGTFLNCLEDVFHSRYPEHTHEFVCAPEEVFRYFTIKMEPRFIRVSF